MKRHPPRPGVGAGSPTLKRLPTREEFIRGGVLLGGNEDEMGAGYDRWLASQQGAGNGISG